ncbi:MAG TPA: hypothetical protein VMU56_01320, partial [Beijerinckiaceae bacterium]|nr:hypothetical protein [Beijerinckiaceae bacterium]
MAAPLQKPMTGEEFEVWHRGQTERYEFVDGAPRPKFSRWEGAKMMVGATQGHNLIAGNAYTE